MLASSAHLLLGSYIADIILRGKVGLKDAEAGSPHALTHCLGEVAQSCVHSCHYIIVLSSYYAI